ACRFRRDVAHGETGAARGEHHVDSVSTWTGIAEREQLRGQPGRSIGNDVTGHESAAARSDPFADQRTTRILARACCYTVGHRDHGDTHGPLRMSRVAVHSHLRADPSL